MMRYVVIELLKDMLKFESKIEYFGYDVVVQIVDKVRQFYFENMYAVNTFFFGYVFIKMKRKFCF